MRQDDESDLIKGDALILYTAQLYLDRQESQDNTEHIRSRLRLLAKIVLACGLKSLRATLKPEHFNKMCEVVQGFDAASNKIKIGQFLKQSTADLKSIAIKQDLTALQDSCTNLIHLFSSEWKHRISHKARLEADQGTFNKIPLLPLSKDILKVRTFLEEQIEVCIKDYDGGYGKHVKAKKTLGCKVTVFNKRRGMEFNKSTREEIKLAIQMTESGASQSELSEYLSPLEQQLTTTMHLLKVKGKQGKGVPVLLASTDYKLLKYILADPACEQELFMFQSDGERPYRGDKMLHDFSKSMGLERPEAIR